jgi:hypothetical protein
VITRNGRHKNNGVHILDGVPQTIAHGAEEGATRLAEAAEIAGARVSKGAGQFAKSAGKGAGQASGVASDLSGQIKGQASELSGQLKGQTKELSGQLKGRVAQQPVDLKNAKQSVKDAKVGMRKAGLGARERALHSIVRSRSKRRGRLQLPSADAMVKAQLVKTSRELAHESSDLNSAVESLNRIIKNNRKAAARGRTRLIGGLALGAALMYHLDAEHGRERRAATGRLLVGIVRGEDGTPPGAV